MSSIATKPELPPNVIIWSPTRPGATEALLKGRIFTRLTATRATPSEQLSATVENVISTATGDTFCLAYRDGILIFDGGVEAGQEDSDLTDLHHEHFRMVCLALKDADIDLDVAGCVFDSPSILQAGFQLDTLRPGTLLVIDLMGGEDEDNEEEEEDDTAEASLGDLLSLGR